MISQLYNSSFSQRLLTSMALLLLFIIPPVHADTYKKALLGFEQPQDSCRTKVWWFFGETETTREGITADLQAFKAAGVGGVVYYDQVHSAGQGADPAFSPHWWEMLRFAAEEAKRLGLTFEINISNGFVAGGPWITYTDGMKRLDYSEIHVSQGIIDTLLPLPVSCRNYHKDVAVVAFPTPAGGATSTISTPPYCTTSNAALDISPLLDPVTKARVSIPRLPAGQSTYINMDFGTAFTARSITYNARPRGKATTSATNVPGTPGDTFVGTGYRVLPMLGQLEKSDDGVHYQKVCDLLPIYRAHGNWSVKTLSFPAVTARYFRLNFHDWQEAGEKADLKIGNVVLHSSARVDQWEEKAGLYSEYIKKDRTPAFSGDEVIDPASVIDLTDCVDASGRLRWKVPQGQWTVMRFCMAPTGGSIKHGRKNLMGLECDKLSAKAAQLQWDHYVGVILDSLRTTDSGEICGIIMDSHEAGSQNWTDEFPAEFHRRQGYDLRPFLPVMAGKIVASTARSNGFLHDVRRNIADMISDNYYGTLDSLCRSQHLTLTAQATGNALCIVADPIQAKSRVGKPQGEFWEIHPDGNYDIKECSSAAHMYGKTIASGEAFTDAKYSASLATLKKLADYAYCYGTNEFVVCASAYQPWTDKIPGNTGGGRHYCLNRNNTYWEFSRPFWDYQARCAHIMRQGKSQADLCIYLGENAPVKILTYRLPDIPGGYDFDAFTTDALLNRMSARDGQIILPDGVSYRLMILPRNGEITFSALQKIAALVKDGATVYGIRAIGSNSGKDSNRLQEYNELKKSLWGETPGTQGIHLYGKGKVMWGMSLAKALDTLHIQPDVSMQKGDTRRDSIYFIHRRLKDCDVYMLHNHKNREEHNHFTFGNTRKHAELWDAVTGTRTQLTLQNGQVPLTLAPWESKLVVLTDTDNNLPDDPSFSDVDTLSLCGNWKVWFDPKMGGIGNTLLPVPMDWRTSVNPAVKYYSGKARYTREIKLDKKALRSGKWLLSTEEPGFIARLTVNGKPAGILWCSPWQTDITSLLKAGKNIIEITVANSLMNRMIGDAGLPESERITFAWPPITSPTDSLLPSGLCQPVVLIHKK